MVVITAEKELRIFTEVMKYSGWRGVMKVKIDVLKKNVTWILEILLQIKKLLVLSWYIVLSIINGSIKCFKVRLEVIK